MRTFISCACLAVAIALGAIPLTPAHAQAPATQPTQPVASISEDDALYAALRLKMTRQVEALNAALVDPETNSKVKELDSLLTDMATWENHFEGIRKYNPNPLNLEVNTRSYAAYVRHARTIAEELQGKLESVCSDPHATVRAMRTVVPNQSRAHDEETYKILGYVDKSCEFVQTALYRTSEFSARSNHHFHDRRRETPLTRDEADYLAAKVVLERQLYR